MAGLFWDLGEKGRRMIPEKWLPVFRQDHA